MQQEALEKEFVESFSLYGDAIFRFCLIKVSNKELAEDMTQEVFARYWQSLRKGSVMSNTRSFLYTIAHNLAKDWYKKKKSYSLDEQMDQGLEPRDRNELDQQTKAEYEEVLAVIKEMEDKDKEVLMLRFVEGLEPKDIAHILNESANTISVRVNRASERLRQKLHTHET